MILYVAEVCAAALGQENVYVATESDRIAAAVREAGFQAVLTSDKCLTGTDRLAEAARSIPADVYVNVQGDEPLLDPKDIQRVASEKIATPGMVINCYQEIGPEENPESPNLPKVIMNEAGMLVYMSRRALPGFKIATNRPSVYYKQVCIYGFSAEDLARFAQHGRKGKLEWHEDIEILRFLDLGVPVRMIRASRVSYAVDTPEDVAVVEAALRART
jgi:3-deoxy-manno-octulosonate cytidylyltransferase (CMP-KDO synthetase)